MALLCHLGTSAINLLCGLHLVSPAAGFISFLRRGCTLHSLWVPLSLFVLSRSTLTKTSPSPWHPLVPPPGSCGRQAELSTQAIIKLGFMALPPATHSLHSFPMRSLCSPGGWKEGWVRNLLRGPICPANAAFGFSFQLFDMGPLHHNNKNPKTKQTNKKKYKKNPNNPAWVCEEKKG